MARISKDDYFINIAIESAKRGTCSRRSVGCVLIDSIDHILSTGFNGNAHGQPHCIDKPCVGALHPSGEGLDDCESIHAEINAIVHCRDIQSIVKCYTTLSPCVSCVKALLASPCQEIIFLEEYPHSKSKELWENSGRKWNHHKRNTILKLI